MEGFEYHMFLWRQVFLHLLARRQHDDLRKLTAGIKPACSQMAQEVRRVGRGGNAEIEENQRGSSRGSTPTTFPPATFRYMPHGTPQ